MINKKTAPKCLLSKISQNRNGAVVFVIFVYCISVYWHWTSARSYNTERCALLQVKHNSFMCSSKSRQKCDLKSSELNLISIPSTKYMTMFRWYHKISMLFWCITFSMWFFFRLYLFRYLKFFYVRCIVRVLPIIYYETGCVMSCVNRFLNEIIISESNLVKCDRFSWVEAMGHIENRIWIWRARNKVNTMNGV